jgi:WD40 repeat protein
VSQDPHGARGGAWAVPGPGSQVAGYLLEQQLGAGGMAVVFRARDVRLGRLVALKVMAPTMAGDDTFRRRFVREARAAAAVDDPHIIPVYEAGDAGGVLFIAMRFVNGGDVGSLVRREGPMSAERTMSVISPVASALDAAHAVGLVHRDVKPANMLIDTGPGRPDHVYLSDFGLSKGSQSGQLTGSGQFLGTPDYTAPEQIAAKTADGQADQYALACSAFELLTGVVPFANTEGWATVWAHLNTAPPTPTTLRPELPPAVDAVLARGMAKNPQDRYPSCGAFADDLRAVLGGGSYPLGAPAVGTGSVPTSAAPTIGNAPATGGMWRPDLNGTTSPDRSAPRARRRRGRVIAVAGAVVVCAAVAAALLVPRLTGGNPSLASDRTGQSQVDDVPMYGMIAAFTPPRVAGRWQEPTSVAFGPNGKALAVGLTTGPTGEYTIGTANGETYLYNVATRKQFGVMAAGGGTVAFGLGGLLAASGGIGQHAVYLSHDFGPPTALPGAGDLPIRTVAFGPDGVLLAANDSIGGFHLWSTVTRRPVANQLSAAGEIFAFAFSPDGNVLAVGQPGSLSFWNLASDSVMSTLPIPANSVAGSMAYSPDGRLLAATFPGGVIRVWSTTTGNRVATLQATGSDTVNDVAFSPNSHMLAAGGVDGQTYLWDIRTRTLVTTLASPVSAASVGLDAEPVGGVDSVAFSPDGTTLATSDTDGSAYLWRVG